MHHHICLLGGTGFVGHALVARLEAAGHHTTLLTRQWARHRDLLVYPHVQVAQGDPHDPACLHRVFQGHDVVINLIGILNESRRARFDDVHARLPGAIVAACHDAGVRRLVHMSALGAGPEAGPNARSSPPSVYLQSKAAGERSVLAAHDKGLAVTVFRPSVIFGPGDSFLHRFAGLVKYAPILPLACPDARFQPVHVADVARAFADCLDVEASHGRAFDLCGSEQIALREVVSRVARATGRPCRVLGLNDFFSRLQARILGHLPGRLLTYDNYLSLKRDSVCPPGRPEWPAWLDRPEYGLDHAWSQLGGRH